MSTLSIRIPESLHRRIKIVASQDNISINQFISSALAEKLSAFDTDKYLVERAEQGNRNKYLNVLEKVKNREPKEYDR